jgi:hypothetical protein
LQGADWELEAQQAAAHPVVPQHHLPLVQPAANA